MKKINKSFFRSRKKGGPLYLPDLPVWGPTAGAAPARSPFGPSAPGGNWEGKEYT
jgi:hypothetical protein